MPIRRFNSTGRRAISRDRVQLKIQRKPAEPAVLVASLDFSGSKLPNDALVFLEASQLSTFMRFPFGSVASPKPPNGKELVLSEFSPDHLPTIRVKVVSVGDRSGLLLAESGALSADPDQDHPAKTSPLLNFAEDDLGEEIWRVSFGTDLPTVQMNKKLGDWKALASAPHFRAIVYPAVFRTVLMQILLVEEFEYDEDDDSWQSRWLQFGKMMAGETPPVHEEDPAEVMHWITGAAEAFAKKHGFLGQLGDFNPGGVYE